MKHYRNITEKSVLDYFIVNSELFNGIIGLEIDEEKSCTSFKSWTFKKKTEVTFTNHCVITVAKINAISKHKIQVENKWAFTQDEQEKFRENTTITKGFQILISYVS